MARKPKNIETPPLKYEKAINRGRMLANTFLRRGDASEEIYREVNKVRSQHSSRNLNRIVAYYAREDVQQAMFQYAQGRKVTILRTFKPLFPPLVQPKDVLHLSMFCLLQKTYFWPSLHGTISREQEDGPIVCDFVVELDYKSDWAGCFEMSRPIVKFFEELGLFFLIKFSGHCSPHIIIPAEAFPQRYMSPQMFHGLHRALMNLIRRKVSRPNYIDMSFHSFNHFLRMVYSLNEQYGMVSVPIPVEQYDSFSPRLAQPDNIIVNLNWWQVPDDAIERTETLLKLIHAPQPVAAKPKPGFVPLVEHQFIEVEHRLTEEPKDQQKKRFPILSSGEYQHLVNIGQKYIEKRLSLLQKSQIPSALRILRRLRAKGFTPNPKEIAHKSGVSETDLNFMLRWERCGRVLRHYARADVQQAMHNYAQNRKVCVGNLQRLLYLKEPTDIFPLAAYICLNSDEPVDYPAFYCTNAQFNALTDEITACDIVINIIPENEDVNPIKAAMPIISLLDSFGVAFLLKFDGYNAPEIIIPYSAISIENQSFQKRKRGESEAKTRHQSMIGTFAERLKPMMRNCGATCSLPQSPYHCSLLPYSVHEETGMASIPMNLKNIRNFSHKMAWLGKIEVNLDWDKIPQDAAKQTEKFLRDVAVLRI